jgi:uncharacterized protein (DUF1015 family)
VNIVRPFPARIVRQDWARRAVVAMTESLDETSDNPVRIPIDPAAYDESAAALYVYRQRSDDASHTGVVCEVAMHAFVDGRIRGHEAVYAQRVEALVRHYATTTAPPALITLLHHAGPAFKRTIDATCRTPPILDFAGPGGFQQTVWRVAEGSATAAVVEELAAANHYIADGHHRVAAALEEWRLGSTPADAGLLCVVHPIDDLRLSAFHRRVTGPVAPADLIELLTPEFQVRAAPETPAPTLGSFGLYVGGGWFDVRYQRRRGDGPSGLDVALLEERVLKRLGRLPPGPAYTVEITPARTTVDELAQRCDADRGALFTLAPPSPEALTRLADAGEVMPPKTTYFEPKPCAGIFLRP